MSSKCLAELSVHSIGGGWGLEEQDSGHTQKVAVIRGTDIPRVASGDYSTVPIRWEKPSKTRSRLLHPGDIIVEVSGGSSAKGQHTGRALLVDQRIIDGLGGAVIPASFCRLLRLDSGQVNSDFITYQIASMHISGEIADFENQSTGISNFQFTKFLESVKPKVLDIGAQREIVSVLRSLDDRIDNLRATNATLEAIAQAIFKSWFIDFDPVRAKMEGREPEGMDAETAALFPSEFEESELGMIPRGWRVSNFGEVCSLMNSGNTPPRNNDNYWRDGSVDWYKTKELWDDFLFGSEERITEKAIIEKKARSFHDETILMAIYGSPTVGRLGITTQRSSCNQAALGMRPREDKITFWTLYLSLKKSRDHFNNIANGAAQQNISKEKVAESLLIHPHIEVQNKFDNTVAQLMNLVRRNGMAIGAMAELRDLLLPRLISGKLRIDEAQKAVEVS